MLVYVLLQVLRGEMLQCRCCSVLLLLPDLPCETACWPAQIHTYSRQITVRRLFTVSDAAYFALSKSLLACTNAYSSCFRCLQQTCHSVYAVHHFCHCLACAVGQLAGLHKHIHQLLHVFAAEMAQEGCWWSPVSSAFTLTGSLPCPSHNFQFGVTNNL